MGGYREVEETVALGLNWIQREGAGMNGYAQEKDAHLRRMRRIEGHLCGIAKMIEAVAEGEHVAEDKLAEANAAIARLVMS